MPACPRCRAKHERDVELVPAFGALLEDVCPECQGRFLGAAAVERVVIDELGLSSSLLREMTGLFASKTRLPCPSCGSKLSPLELRKVRIDLCTGCGGAWLDAGELTSLSEGRHAELSASPSSPSSPSSPPGPPGPSGATSTTPSAEGASAGNAPLAGVSGRCVVFFDDPTSVAREALTAAFTRVPGLAAPDAAQIVARQRCTAVEGASDLHARRIVETLAAEGIGAHVADESWLSLPPAVRTGALAADERGLVLGRMADVSGRIEAPWASVAAMAAGHVMRSTLRRTLSARQTQERVVNEPEMDLSIVEAADVCVDIVLASPARRYRLLLSTMIFGTPPGEAARPRRALLDERFDEVVRHAPPTLALGRGITAGDPRGGRGSDRPLPRYASMRDLERELGWLLWRAFGKRALAQP